ncbi:penicillin-insensitive murein endopeptidase [Bradymonas sediminis]|uniref:Uncharacterized protein n=1 Tax=Bradymonas sediminis TaxID=1548548 RepID=A0A2Z4FJX5_9DELT|nr:penicillin-insensitive murein endopeptidase [Bradymonas sediminis]AWV89271.1 hypothetical protein DN745_07925 [Bradymonas sediminis]TDP73442.1 LysM domain-containing protein [Bradymonas sediminis]
MRFESNNSMQKHVTPPQRRWNVGVGLRSLSLSLVVVAVAVLTPNANLAPAEAQAPPPSVASSLSLASAGLGPVALNAIMEPGTLERIARRIRDERWKLPDDPAAWPIEDGKPVVQTQQLNELWHTILPGETLKRLRQMYRLNNASLQRLNPGVNLNDLSPGQRIRVWERDPDTFSKSYGAANRGRLFNGEPLPDSPYYRILYPHRAFGTYYTVSEVSRVLNNYGKAYPDSEPLMVGDISFRVGRKIHPHASHRTGRDIDISYPRKNAAKTLRRFGHVRRNELDAKKLLVILKDLLDGGHVEYIFIDRWHQRTLRAEALAQGATEEWVDRVFQYPAYSGGDAIVRHARGHHKHFHVRFACQETDRRCR